MIIHPEHQPPDTDDKEAIFTAVAQYLKGLSMHVTSIDSTRPWGGFFVIEETDTDTFIEQLFPGYSTENIQQFGSKLSPMILVVGPEEELSGNITTGV